MAKEATGPNIKMMALSFTAIILMATFAVSLWKVSQDAAQGAQLNALAREAALQSQSLAKNSSLAIAGDRNAFLQIGRSRDKLDETLENLRNFPSTSTDVTSEITLLSDNWKNTGASVSDLLDAGDAINIAHKQITLVNDNFPQLFVAMDQLTRKLAQRNGSRNFLYHLGRQGQFGQRLHRDLNTIVLGGGNVQSAADRMANDAAYYGRIIRAFYDGDSELGLAAVTTTDIRADLDSARIIWGRVDQAYQTLASMQNTLLLAHTAKDIVILQSDTMLGNARTIEQQHGRILEDRIWSTRNTVVLGVALAGNLLVLFGFYSSGSDTRRAAALQQEQQERNQEAILRLLDELGSLADGDLTIKATVTEDITGAIADSINFAIEALRDLVVTVNDTALRVDAAAKQTEATATHLAEASNNQSTQITSASGQIAAMAKSIEQVSANAERSAKVAQQSVEIANKGGEAVRRTIDGMSSIRESIQETSKRIKRLGESSQEIGDIVELINDIAEQTNILALNAAIQASMAGEAGRGFAVVADEVQRLAERSANATKQIEALVKAIQTDTNEAVISMEQSTSGVVGGAQLAENAGSALDEIVKVSAHIATLIQSISTTARQQSTTASDVSRTMSVIQEITSQTAEGTHATARNVGKLATLATELRKSVAGFKLPGMGDGETLVVLDDELDDS